MASPILALAPLIALVLTGCGKQAWPEVSRENCQPAKTFLIKDLNRRAQFIGFCSSIPSTAWPIHPDKWFALSDEDRAFFVKSDPRAPRMGDTPNPLNWLSIKP